MTEEILQQADPSVEVRVAFFNSLKKEAAAGRISQLLAKVDKRFLAGGLSAVAGGSAAYGLFKRRGEKPSLAERIEGDSRFSGLVRRASDNPGKAAAVAAVLSGMYGTGRSHNVLKKRKIAAAPYKISKQVSAGRLLARVRDKFRRSAGRINKFPAPVKAVAGESKAVSAPKVTKASKPRAPKVRRPTAKKAPVVGQDAKFKSAPKLSPMKDVLKQLMGKE